jgi:N-hydroxyarylamine O-acetyltransferase
MMRTDRNIHVYPSLSAEQIVAYLRRIDYTGTTSVTAATLHALQVAHLHHVPFENLDILRQTPLSLAVPHLFDKIITRRRGGICYELNTLFAALLTTLGFPVTLLSASDAHADGGYGPPFDHLALHVRTPAADHTATDWLVDVGWGDTFRTPLRLAERGVQTQGMRAYRLEEVGDTLTVWQQLERGEWERTYRFTRTPHLLEAFTAALPYHQTAPDAPFSQRRLCTLARPDGRITLTQTRLIETREGVRTEQPLKAEAEAVRLLEERFGLA